MAPPHRLWLWRLVTWVSISFVACSYSYCPGFFAPSWGMTSAPSQTSRRQQFVKHGYTFYRDYGLRNRKVLEVLEQRNTGSAAQQKNQRRKRRSRKRKARRNVFGTEWWHSSKRPKKTWVHNLKDLKDPTDQKTSMTKDQSWGLSGFLGYSGL